MDIGGPKFMFILLGRVFLICKTMILGGLVKEREYWAKFSPSSNRGPVVSPKLLMLKSLNMVGASRHLPIYGRTKVCNHGLELVNF